VILKICEVGNPVLRKIARSLSADEIRSKDIQDLIGHMRDTMRDAPGVGLAAPQIGESLQIAVIEDKAEYQKGTPPTMPAASSSQCARPATP
jgi:peptide deformylase